MDGIHEGKSGTGRERGEKIHFPKRLAFVFDLRESRDRTILKDDSE